METRHTLPGGSSPDPKSHHDPLSLVLKRSITLVGHKTSVSLEDQFWDGLHEIAASEGVTTSALIERIDTMRTVHNLSSAIRLFVLDHFRTGSDKAPQTSTKAR
jgi:predicted DNA-binding ribbon-helix-helix protein